MAQCGEQGGRPLTGLARLAFARLFREGRVTIDASLLEKMPPPPPTQLFGVAVRIWLKAGSFQDVLPELQGEPDTRAPSPVRRQAHHEIQGVAGVLAPIPVRASSWLFGFREWAAYDGR